MIRFTHGHNAANRVAAAAAVAPASSVNFTPIAIGAFEPPLHMRPLPISDEEIDAIRYGGCADYELNPKKALPAKKAGAKAGGIKSKK